MCVSKISNKKVFDDCCSVYLSEDKHWGSDLDIIKEYSEKFSAISILDAGTGSAWHLINLFSLLSRSVRIKKAIGLDQSEYMLEQAKGLLTSNQINGNSFDELIELKRGNILSLPFHNRSFEIVLCLNNTLGNIYDKNVKDACSSRNKALKEMYRVLKPGGYLILSVYNADKFTQEDKYGDVFELDSTLSDLRNCDLIIRFKKTDTLYYSHWFKINEIKNLLRKTNFALNESENRRKRIVVSAQRRS